MTAFFLTYAQHFLFPGQQLACREMQMILPEHRKIRSSVRLIFTKSK